MITHELPLSAVEEAFAALVFDEYDAALQAATSRRDARLAVIMDAKGIAKGTRVRIEPHTAEQPARLVYQAPDEPALTLSSLSSSA